MGKRLYVAGFYDINWFDMFPCWFKNLHSVMHSCRSSRCRGQYTFYPSMMERALCFHALCNFNDIWYVARTFQISTITSHTRKSLALLNDLGRLLLEWASFQMPKLAGCACAGNVWNGFPAIANLRFWHASRHACDARAVMHAGIAN